ncbi:lipoprotein, partial [Williamsoniiplasma luminosum]
MKKLLALLGSLLMVGGSATTVVACGTRVYDRVNISDINIDSVHVGDDFEQLKQDIETEIIEISKEARIEVDYVINGDTNKPGTIVVVAVPSSKLLEGKFEISVGQIDISKIQINDIKVGLEKASVEDKIDKEIKGLFVDAQLGLDYVIEGLDDLLRGTKIIRTGLISVIANEDYLTGGFLLEINENGSTTTPLPPTKPTIPGYKKKDISKIEIKDVTNKTTMVEVKTKVAEKIKTISKEAILGADYLIVGNPQQDKIIKVKTISSSSWIEENFEIQVKQDISNIEINNINVGMETRAIEGEILNAVKSLYDNAKLDTDYKVEGLKNLLIDDQDEKIDITGYVSVLAIGDYLMGAFLLEISEDGSITKPIEKPNRPTIPDEKKDIYLLQGEITDVDNETDKKELDAIIYSKIKEFAEQDVLVGWDYIISGDPKKDKIIKVSATSLSELIEGSFTINVKPVIRSIDISDVEVNDIKYGDNIDQAHAKIAEKIKAKYEDAQLRQDYTVEGLEKIIKEGVIGIDGKVTVKGVGARLHGGFDLEINENGSTTKPFEPGTNPPGSIRPELIPLLTNIENIKITDVTNKTTEGALKNKIEEEIQKISKEAKFGIDYLIEGNPKNDKQIQVKATGSSKWIIGSFTIDVKQLNLTENISKIQAELQAILDERPTQTWTDTDLQNRINTRYGNGEITVQKSETSNRISGENLHQNKYNFIGNGTEYNKFKYDGNITLTHKWKETVDKSEDISTITKNLQDILSGRKESAWTQSELQIEVDKIDGVGAITVQ